MTYCQVGDTPTVYYKFQGKTQYEKVSFNLAPIGIDVENLSTSSGGGGGSGGDTTQPTQPLCYPRGNPALGTVCRLEYWSWMDWWVPEGSPLGEGYSEDVFGAGPLPGSVGSKIYAGENTYEGWRYEYSYRPTNTTRTDEDGTRTLYYYVVAATKSFRFSGQPPTELPSEYEMLEAGWGLLSDSCGWIGNPNCSMSPPPPPPPSDGGGSGGQSSDPKVKLKVFQSSTGKLLWERTGKPPLEYEVSCKRDECPPGFMKLKSTNAQGFCCIKCADIKQQIATIKSLIR